MEKTKYVRFDTEDDDTWKNLFEKDFPDDWAYCKGQLPFFIITETHPLYLKNYFKSYVSGWKRFYKHTQALYVEIFNMTSGLEELQLPFDELYLLYKTTSSSEQDFFIAHYCHLFVYLINCLIEGKADWAITKSYYDPVEVVFIEKAMKRVTENWMKHYINCAVLPTPFGRFEPEKNVLSDFTPCAFIASSKQFEHDQLFLNHEEVFKLSMTEIFSEEHGKLFPKWLQGQRERVGFVKKFNLLNQNEKDLDEYQNIILSIYNGMQQGFLNRKSIYTHPLVAKKYGMFLFAMFETNMFEKFAALFPYYKDNELYQFYFRRNRYEINNAPYKVVNFAQLIDPLSYINGIGDAGLKKISNLFVDFTEMPLVIVKTKNVDAIVKMRNDFQFQKAETCSNKSCTNVATHVCSGCFNQEYCSRECQLLDYKLGHKVECLNIGSKKLSKQKAKEILKHGEVHGHQLTDKQRKYMYWMSEK